MLVDKPGAMTSHGVVQRVRRVLGIRAAGHTGTLDPFATGLLIVLVGRATRLSRFVEGQSKTYLATARLGVRTDSDDLTGRPIGVASDTVVSEAQVQGALARFKGTQLQRPPLYSAKHVGGERSHRKARRGEPVELADVTVTVHELELVEYRPPEVTFRTVVSAGTYIRALARDLGERLGVGAHLSSLRREAIGSIRVDDAVPLERLSPAAVLPPQTVIGNLPTVDLDESARLAVKQGRAVRGGCSLGSGAARRRGGEAVALLAAGRLVAIASSEDGWLRPMVLLDSV